MRSESRASAGQGGCDRNEDRAEEAIRGGVLSQHRTEEHAEPGSE